MIFVFWTVVNIFDWNVEFFYAYQLDKDLAVWINNQSQNVLCHQHISLWCQR